MKFILTKMITDVINPYPSQSKSHVLRRFFQHPGASLELFGWDETRQWRECLEPRRGFLGDFSTKHVVFFGGESPHPLRTVVDFGRVGSEPRYGAWSNRQTIKNRGPKKHGSGLVEKGIPRMDCNFSGI